MSKSLHCVEKSAEFLNMFIRGGPGNKWSVKGMENFEQYTLDFTNMAINSVIVSQTMSKTKKRKEPLLIKYSKNLSN